MSEARTSTPPLTPTERLELANRLFREFYAQCFWHWDPKIVINEPMLPALVKGLRTYGGQRAMHAAARLLE